MIFANFEYKRGNVWIYLSRVNFNTIYGDLKYLQGTLDEYFPSKSRDFEPVINAYGSDFGSGINYSWEKNRNSKSQKTTCIIRAQNKNNTK